MVHTLAPAPLVIVLSTGVSITSVLVSFNLFHFQGLFLFFDQIKMNAHYTRHVSTSVPILTDHITVTVQKVMNYK